MNKGIKKKKFKQVAFCISKKNFFKLIVLLMDYLYICGGKIQKNVGYNFIFQIL